MSTWPQRESPETIQEPLGDDQYFCPLDSTPLNDEGNHWWCEHESQPGGSHESVLAYHSEGDRMVRYQDSCIVPVIDE